MISVNDVYLVQPISGTSLALLAFDVRNELINWFGEHHAHKTTEFQMWIIC